MKALLLALVAALTLAGCGDPAVTPGGTDTGQPPLAEGKGAISGLLINDVFRPIPRALILLQGTGLTATTDDAGQFTFLDLEPGAYIAIVSAEGHEAAPTNIDVAKGLYKEVEIQARRLINEGGQILTAQYSLFMTCSAELVIVAGNGLNCLQDLSGDSERTGFASDLTGYANVTYMVTEIRFNRADDYDFVIAWDNDGDAILDDYWAEHSIVDGDYGRIVLKAGEANTEDDAGRNLVWEPANRTFQTTVFPHGELYTELSGFGVYGAGVDVGVRASIVQSVFLGKPPVDIATYRVL